MPPDVIIGHLDGRDEPAERLVRSLGHKGIEARRVRLDGAAAWSIDREGLAALSTALLFVAADFDASGDPDRFQASIEAARNRRIPVLVGRAGPGAGGDALPLEPLSSFVDAVAARLRSVKFVEGNERPVGKPFIGREDDLAAIGRDLAQGSLALTGRAGVGKTVLASRVFDHATTGSAFPCHAVYWRRFDGGRPVGFAGFGRSLLRDLAFGEEDFEREPMSGQVDRVLDALRRRRVLLIVDQLESALDPATGRPFDSGWARFLAALTRPTAGEARALLVSRLRPSDEDGRAFPNRDLEGLPARESLALFTARAGRRISDTIAARWDGHPLALVLAAGDTAETALARLPVENPAAMAADVIGRLEPGPRTVLFALGVFSAPVPADTAAGISGRPDAAEALRELGRRGLIVETASGAVEPQMVVRPLLGRLVPPEERRRLCLEGACFLAGVSGPDAETSQREAVDLFLAADRADLAAGLFFGEGLGEGLFWRGEYAALEETAGRLHAAGLPPREAIALQILRGKAMRNQGRLEAAREAYREALALAAADPEGETGLMVALGDVSYYLRDLDSALAYHRKAAELLAIRPDARLASENAGDWANVMLAVNRIDEAAALYEQALAAAREARLPRYEGIWHGGLGNIAAAKFERTRDQAWRRSAEEHLREAVRLAVETGDRRHESHWSGVLGSFLRSAGDLPGAESHLRRAVVVARAIGYGRMLDTLRSWLDAVVGQRIERSSESGSPDAAKRAAGEFLAFAQSLGDPDLEAAALRRFEAADTPLPS